MTIVYDRKRKDITFCTMLFKMPQQSDLNSLKNINRKFEDFYLPSLKQMVQTFQRVVLWCDKETFEYIFTLIPLVTLTNPTSSITKSLLSTISVAPFIFLSLKIITRYIISHLKYYRI